MGRNGESDSGISISDLDKKYPVFRAEGGFSGRKYPDAKPLGLLIAEVENGSRREAPVSAYLHKGVLKRHLYLFLLARYFSGSSANVFLQPTAQK